MPFPCLSFALFLPFLASRKNQWDWTLPTVLQSSVLLSMVVLLEV